MRALLEAPSQFFTGQNEEENRNVQPELQMSFMELYNDSAFDLLEPKGREIRIDDFVGPQAQDPDLARVLIESNEQFTERFRQARNGRTTAPTRLKEHSSPSHAMLILYIRYADGSNIFR